MRRIHQQIHSRYSRDLPVGVAAARQIRLAMSSQMCDKCEHLFEHLQPRQISGKPVLCPVKSFLPSETGFLPSETMQRSCTDAHAELREGAARPRTGPLHRLCPRCRTRSVCRCLYALCYQSTRRSVDTAAPDILRLVVVVAATAGQITR